MLVDLHERDLEWASTNALVIRAASHGITTIASHEVRGGIVRCENCFAEGTLNKGLIDDEAESAVVRPRGQFV